MEESNAPVIVGIGMVLGSYCASWAFPVAEEELERSRRAGGGLSALSGDRLAWTELLGREALARCESRLRLLGLGMNSVGGLWRLDRGQAPKGVFTGQPLEAFSALALTQGGVSRRERVEGAPTVCGGRVAGKGPASVGTIEAAHDAVEEELELFRRQFGFEGPWIGRGEPEGLFAEEGKFIQESLALLSSCEQWELLRASGGEAAPSRGGPRL